MKNLFLISGIILCLFSCKTQTTETANQYTTPPEIGQVTTDIPRYSKPPVQNNHDEALPPTSTTSTINSDSVSLSKKDSLMTVENNTTVASDTKTSVIQTVDTSRFSWEIGIRATQILDVRTLAEFKNGHIYDAVNMNVDDPSFVLQIQSLDKNSPVAVYCRSGIRSLHAAKILEENGFQIIYNLKGGLNQWIKDGKEIVK